MTCLQIRFFTAAAVIVRKATGLRGESRDHLQKKESGKWYEKRIEKDSAGTGVALLILTGGASAGAAEKEQEYIFQDTDKELLTEEDVKDLPAQLLPMGGMRFWQSMETFRGTEGLFRNAEMVFRFPGG